MPADPHKQFIFKMFAKTSQCAAHCLLRDEESFGCSRYVSLREQSIERSQQIEIEMVKLHGSPPNKADLTRDPGKIAWPVPR